MTFVVIGALGVKTRIVFSKKKKNILSQKKEYLEPKKD